MTKKRVKKYRPKPVLVDPIKYALMSCRTMSSFKDGLNTLKIRHYAAWQKLADGKADLNDVNLIVQTLNNCQAFHQMGFGADCYDIVKSAQKAVAGVARRGKDALVFTPTNEEIEAIRLGIELHEAQLDVATVKDFERAEAIVKETIRNKRADEI